MNENFIKLETILISNSIEKTSIINNEVGA